MKMTTKKLPSNSNPTHISPLTVLHSSQPFRFFIFSLLKSNFLLTALWCTENAENTSESAAVKTTSCSPEDLTPSSGASTGHRTRVNDEHLPRATTRTNVTEWLPDFKRSYWLTGKFVFENLAIGELCCNLTF